MALSYNRDFCITHSNSAPASYLLDVSGQQITVFLRESKRAKKVTLRFDQHHHHFVLTVPLKCPTDLIADFLSQHRTWITHQYQQKSQLILFQANEVIPFLGSSLIIDYHKDLHSRIYLSEDQTVLHVHHIKSDIGALTESWLHQQAKHHICSIALAKTAQLGQSVANIRIKELRSRWGSCSQRRNLNFSWRLILAPSEVCDYVIAHEVAHLQEMNHGPKFWALTHQLCHHVCYSREWLYYHGWSLHRYVSDLP